MNYDSIIKDFLEKEKPYPKKIQKLLDNGVINKVIRINDRYFLLVLCFHSNLYKFYSQFWVYNECNLWHSFDGEMRKDVDGEFKRFIYGYIIFDNRTSKICSSLINMIIEPYIKNSKRYYCAPQKILPTDKIKFDDVFDFNGNFYFPLTYMTESNMWVHNIKNIHKKEVYQVGMGEEYFYKNGNYFPALSCFDRSNTIDIKYIENICGIKIDESSLVQQILSISNIVKSIEKATDVFEAGLNKVAFTSKLTADAITNKK